MIGQKEWPRSDSLVWHILGWIGNPTADLKNHSPNLSGGQVWDLFVTFFKVTKIDCMNTFLESIGNEIDILN